ncbi:MAG TPA: hypothetical protein VK473_11160 [Terriglobales bacterium]|nr:hypothetical protein [Terriglobales bacterium]
MSSQKEKQSKFRLSLDAWAVLIALASAVLVRAGIVKHVPW